jgi:MFS transporter, FHS family, glucose/mannose:H+ symporter
MNWSIFICGGGFLWIAAWIDNLRGPLLPAVTSLLSLDNSEGGLIISLGNLTAMITTWLLMPALNRWSIKQVGLGILCYALIVCAGAMFVDGRIQLFLWGALIGGCISTMGSLSNILIQSGTDPGKRGQIMSALHSLYGLSSFIAPGIAGIVLKEPEHWSRLFVMMVPALIFLAIFTSRFGPKSPSKVDRQKQSQPLSLKPLHVLSISVCVSYVVAEVLTSTWLPTYLVNVYKLDIEHASFYASMFFLTMLVTRMGCGLFAKPRWHRTIIWVSTLLSFSCFVTGKLTGWIWLIPLTGLIGPFFPLYITWLGLRFPDRDRSMVIWMLSGMQAALSLMNFTMGKLADLAGFEIAFWLPAVILILTMILLKGIELKDRAPAT